MTWMAYLILAALAHVLCAGLLLRRQARLVGGWRLGLPEALLGQMAITAAGLAVAAGFVLAAAQLGIDEGNGLYGLGLFALAAVWAAGLARLVPSLAQRAKGSFISPATMRRISRSTFFSTMGWYGCAGLVAGALWWFGQPGLPDAGDPVAAQAAPAPAALAVPAPPRLAEPAPPPPLAVTAQPSPAVSTPAAVVAVAAPAAPAANDTDAVLTAVNAWAAAWARRDADAYLAAYADNFRVPDGMSRAGWEAQRRQRISAAAHIAIAVGSAKVTFSDADAATVSFRQDYRSNLLSAVDNKTLRLARQSSNWKIVEEHSGD
jgi:hypothetical protein